MRKTVYNNNNKENINGTIKTRDQRGSDNGNC